MTAYGRVAMAKADVPVPDLPGALGRQVAEQAEMLAQQPPHHRVVRVALAGLRAGLDERRLNCSGGVRFGDKVMACWIASKNGAHGTLDLQSAIRVSCNAFFYQYGNAAGIDEIVAAGHMLGLGQRSGLTRRASYDQTICPCRYMQLDQAPERGIIHCPVVSHRRDYSDQTSLNHNCGPLCEGRWYVRTRGCASRRCRGLLLR